MSDTISRAAAIDAIGKAIPQLTTPDGCGEFDHEIQIADEAFLDCMKIISVLPSTQPEIIRCEDCIHNGSFDTDCPIEWNGKEYCSFAEGKDDEESLISRQALKWEEGNE